MSDFEFRGFGLDVELVFVGKQPKSRSSAWKITLEKWGLLVKWYEEHKNQDEVDLLFDSAMTCGLCMMYIDKDCIGCPVFAKTGQCECEGTPFDHLRSAVTNADHLRVAKRELRFLKKVYEEEKKK